MKRYFCSGHLDLTKEEFEIHYLPKLCAAVQDGALIVVGDASGADTMVQTFCLGTKYKNVLVYHMLDAPRNNVCSAPTVGGFKNDRERDEAMTLNTDEDIAWVRPGREKSGTAKNLKRRAAT